MVEARRTVGGDEGTVRWGRLCLLSYHCTTLRPRPKTQQEWTYVALTYCLAVCVHFS